MNSDVVRALNDRIDVQTGAIRHLLARIAKLETRVEVIEEYLAQDTASAVAYVGDEMMDEETTGE